jgi:hypothetical protein
MKRVLAVISAGLLGLAPAVVAQGGLGIKGGLSYGNVSNSGLLPGQLEGRTGFAVGLSASSSGMLGWGIEALYAQRGVVSSSDPDSRKLDYIDVPATLHVTLSAGTLAPYAYAGPQISFELKCQAGNTSCPDTDRPKTSYAAVLGGGIRFGEHHGISIEGRYLYGLTDLNLSTVTSAESYKTRSFLLLAGIGL